MKKYVLIVCLAFATSVSVGAQTIDEAKAAFPFTFLNAVEQNMKEPGNVFVSPVSLWIATGMLQSGAAGNTLSEIHNALGLGADVTSDELNAYNRQLISNLRNPNEILNAQNTTEEEQESAPVLETANSMWSDKVVPFLDSFREDLTQNYDAHIETLDLSLQSSMDIVDAWVNENTHGTIPNLGILPNDELRLLLVNTIYFKGGWSMPFDKYSTSMQTFMNDGTTPAGTSMMSSLEARRYSHVDGFRAVELRYGMYGRYRMIVMMPENSDAALSEATYQNVKNGMNYDYFLLRMPKFGLDIDLDLAETLQQMGIVEAFSPANDFSRMTLRELMIRESKQKSHIEIDEEGTVASAATVFGAVDSCLPEDPMELTIDHPFYLTIEDTQTNTILFIGHIRNITDAQQFMVPSEVKMHTVDSNRKTTKLLDENGRIVILHNGKRYTLSGIAME